jgi:hypothetical protein
MRKREPARESARPMAMTPLSDEVRSQPQFPIQRVPRFNRAPRSSRVRLSNGVAPAHRVALSRGATLAACALLAAACGSVAAPSTSSSGGSGSGSGSSSPGTASAGTASAGTASAGTASAGTASAGTASAAKVSLEVTFAASANNPATHYTLRCEPASGTVPDPVVACARLLTGANIFAPRPARIACPMILASSGRAAVTGTYLGQQVHVTIVDGGCDLSRWSKLKSVFG